MLATSRWLTPSLTGVGTHTQLGLPACGILSLTGWPCPACGLTTAFAHLARLQLSASLDAQPMGLPLFLLAGLAVPVSVAGAVRGWPVGTTLQRFSVDRVAVVLAVAMAAVWIARLAALALA